MTTDQAFALVLCTWCALAGLVVGFAYGYRSGRTDLAGLTNAAAAARMREQAALARGEGRRRVERRNMEIN